MCGGMEQVSVCGGGGYGTGECVCRGRYGTGECACWNEGVVCVGGGMYVCVCV